MDFELVFTEEAEKQLKALETNASQKVQLKAVRKALGMMEVNLKHPALHTHKYDGLSGEFGKDVFEAYAQNNTPSAWRIFWHYGPDKQMITIIAITPHP